MQRNCNASL